MLRIRTRAPRIEGFLIEVQTAAKIRRTTLRMEALTKPPIR